MTSSRWQQLSTLFDEARALSPQARAQLLDERCANDPTLRAEVERLLSAHDRVGAFIETPAIAAVAMRSDDAVIGQSFGAYRLVRELARGGMGAVYLAERVDGAFEHRAALKLIKRGMDTDLVLDRFRAERQILATLEHPNIARLLDGGSSADERPFFLMEYIDGRTIDQYANEHGLSIRDRVALFLDVCSAVVYAHRRLVVHRDIKPGNILVTNDGVVKLLDFGIAKVLDPDADETTGTITAARLLTPEYASPEQIDGRHATVRSDVYSLGVVLYRLLTGESPYRLDSRDPASVANAVRSSDPERPATLRRELRGDLDTIVMMALRKEPDRRYQSVAELADDLRRHLDGQPILAKRDRLAYRASKFIRRNRAPAAASLAAAAAVALAVAAWRWPRDQRGVLSSRDRIIVADFSGGDSSLSSAVTEALRVDLSQSSYVQLLSQRQIRSGMARMALGNDVALNDSLARELAIREGVKAFVTGSVTRVGAGYALAAQLVGAEKGELLAAVRQTASDSSEVVASIARLSASMRERMGESLRSVRATPSLAQVTTPSLEALRLYTAGNRFARFGLRDSAVAAYKRSVAIDTGFASAYRALGNSSADQSDAGPTMNYFAHAIANQQRLPFYERYQTIASHALNYLSDYPKAITAFEHLLERYPNDVVALNNLAYTYSAQRKFALQESLLVRAVEVDSTINSVHLGLAMAAVNNGDYDTARRQIDWVAGHDPGFPNLLLARIYVPVSQQDWPNAERMARARIAATRDSTDLIDGYETLSAILITEGRIAEGERVSRDAMRLARKLGAPGRVMTSALRLALVDLRLHGDTAAAIAEMERALVAFPPDSVTEGDRHYDDFARVFAAANRVARAQELVGLAKRRQVDRVLKINPDRHWALGSIAAAEGRRQEAIAELRIADSTNSCPICVLPDLARAYATAGRPDSAIAVYERYLKLPWEWRFETDDTELASAKASLQALYRSRRR